MGLRLLRNADISSYNEIILLCDTKVCQVYIFFDIVETPNIDNYVYASPERLPLMKSP
jgi:hypothetical protein